MAARKRSATQRARDLVETARLHLEGTTIDAIAATIGVSRFQIAYDLRCIRKQWEEKVQTAVAERRAEVLAKLERIEQLAWREWERSREAKVRRKTARKTTEKGAVEDRVEIITEDRIGDPRFLAEVRGALAQQCNLLGVGVDGNNDRPLILPLIEVVVSDRDALARVRELAGRESLQLLEDFSPPAE